MIIWITFCQDGLWIKSSYEIPVSNLVISALWIIALLTCTIIQFHSMHT